MIWENFVFEDRLFFSLATAWSVQILLYKYKHVIPQMRITLAAVLSLSYCTGL